MNDLGNEFKSGKINQGDAMNTSNPGRRLSLRYYCDLENGGGRSEA